MEQTVKFTEAIYQAIDSEMERDPNVIVYGLGVDDPKYIWGTTKDLDKKYGPMRAFDTPLSEDAMTGVGIGMATAGLRPIHVHIRFDFMMLAMNQLINVAAKTHYMYGGRQHCPMVVRGVIGRSWGQGAQHSQALYSYFLHTPGIKVLAPSTPYDAKGGMIAAIRDNNPVVYVEHRLLHFQEGPVPVESYVVEPGKARFLTEGKDITIVGVSYMAVEALRAYSYLEEKGVSAEVIDPVWLNPLDLDSILASARKTGKLLVVDNSWTSCGFSAELLALVAERLEPGEKIKLSRMGFAPTPCPTTPILENEFYPSAVDVASRAFSIVNEGQSWKPQEREDLKSVQFKGPF